MSWDQFLVSTSSPSKYLCAFFSLVADKRICAEKFVRRKSAKQKSRSEFARDSERLSQLSVVSVCEHNVDPVIVAAGCAGGELSARSV